VSGQRTTAALNPDALRIVQSGLALSDADECGDSSSSPALTSACAKQKSGSTSRAGPPSRTR
jgi:hypothetical protein